MDEIRPERQKYHWEMLEDFKNQARFLIGRGESTDSLKALLDFEQSTKKEIR